MDYFFRLCREGFTRRYGENAPREVRDRLEYELSVIHKMGYVNYYVPKVTIWATWSAPYFLTT